MSSSVLVVEDDEILRTLTAEAVSLLGLWVIECTSADQALPLLETSQGIGLVITDICMPGSIDGLEMAKLIWSRWPHLPVILTSGNRVVADGLLPPHATFIRKPWTLNDFHHAVRTYLPR